jgi:hypothetical protein
MKGQTAQNRKNRHHLRPKSRGGQKIQSNLLLIDMERHCAWHKLWGNRTLEEVIALLQRLKSIKDNQKLLKRR